MVRHLWRCCWSNCRLVVLAWRRDALLVSRVVCGERSELSSAWRAKVRPRYSVPWNRAADRLQSVMSHGQAVMLGLAM